MATSSSYTMQDAYLLITRNISFINRYSNIASQCILLETNFRCLSCYAFRAVTVVYKNSCKRSPTLSRVAARSTPQRTVGPYLS